MAELVNNFIGGRWVPAADGSRFDTINPASLEVVASVANNAAADVDAAVKAVASQGKARA